MPTTPNKFGPNDTGDRPMGPDRTPAIAAPRKTSDTAQISPANVKIQKNIVPNEDADFAYTPESVEEVVGVQEYEPKDRIPAGEIVYVRNNFPALVRFTDGYKSDGSFNLLLAAAGQEDSVKSIETFGVLRNPGFQRWWKKGFVTVSNDNRLSPLDRDTSRIEIERLQQIALEGTVTFERTARGSLPVTKDVDLSFLDAEIPVATTGRRR